jgi:hypothetical protein
MSQITAEDILAAVGRRQQRPTLGTEIVIAPRELTSRSREQLNNKTIKELNNSSRHSDVDDIGVQSPLRQTPKEAVSQKAFGSNDHAARTNISRYTCVQVQHARTDKGVKLAITLQTAELKKLKVTAELKRYDRLREVKSRLEDTSVFNNYLEDTKRAIYDLKDKKFCMGRMHRRGKRSQWYCDTLVVGVLNNQDIIDRVVININHEEYEVRLDGQLTDLQSRMYHATGQIGTFQSSQAAPRIEDADWEDC